MTTLNTPALSVLEVLADVLDRPREIFHGCGVVLEEHPDSPAATPQKDATATHLDLDDLEVTEAIVVVRDRLLYPIDDLEGESTSTAGAMLPWRAFWGYL